MWISFLDNSQVAGLLHPKMFVTYPDPLQLHIQKA
jgi:hypothetical protein